ncbi:hypothetical protein LEP1GSC035_2535 [Leptospira noguchii str. 2007001578]|uniref:Uncharacterized protein n=1 Tax=Leptospira noguchii str. 2007001578 TaxID=1049974 RepID=A0ABN0J6I6_9LEPT|nr:hypothetical protein LEP1GSC035_2535 [Leptospira noguchii str. 2007001578]
MMWELSHFCNNEKTIRRSLFCFKRQNLWELLQHKQILKL